jgi:hypothetical protein
MTTKTSASAFDIDRSHWPAGHPAAPHGRVGVLLLNLGTPDGTSYWPMRRYLKEFLSDRRVIEEPRWKWWPILNLIILTVRPKKKGHDNASIWNTERDEGPLKTITRSQAEQLSKRLGGDPRIIIDWAMRYANPTTASRIEALKDQGCDRILLVPLYPHYAAATSATACDQAFRALMTMRWQPAVRVAPSYHDHPVYIEALAKSMQQGLSKDHRHVSRNAAEISDRRRSLSLPMPEDLSTPAGQIGYYAGTLAHDLPITLRQRSLASALHRRNGRAAGQGRREEAGPYCSGLFRRLPGNARRTGRRKPGNFRNKWRTEIRLHPGAE